MYVNAPNGCCQLVQEQGCCIWEGQVWAEAIRQRDYSGLQRILPKPSVIRMELIDIYDIFYPFKFVSFPKLNIRVFQLVSISQDFPLLLCIRPKIGHARQFKQDLCYSYVTRHIKVKNLNQNHMFGSFRLPF